MDTRIGQKVFDSENFRQYLENQPISIRGKLVTTKRKHKFVAAWHSMWSSVPLNHRKGPKWPSTGAHHFAAHGSNAAG